MLMVCEANKDLAFKINALGPRNLAMVCEEIGAKIVSSFNRSMYLEVLEIHH